MSMEDAVKVCSRIRLAPLTNMSFVLSLARLSNRIIPGRSCLQSSHRLLSTTPLLSKDLRIAVIGQSVFGQEVYSLLRRQGKNVVGVFTVPDNNGRPDPLAVQAEKDGTPVYKIKRWRMKGQLLPDVHEQYKSVQATLNVLPYCTQFIPMEIIDGAEEGSIIYHPSILPKHRGASAINWMLMEGDSTAGFTIFWADDGLDTGPILLQRSCSVDINDTVDTLYNRFLFPEGIRAMGEAVQLIEDGKAPRIVQWEGGATYDQLWQKKDVAKVDWSKTALELHNFIRGSDKSPGAWTMIDNQKVTLYGSVFIDDRDAVIGREIEIEGLSRPAVITQNGLVAYGSDGKKIRVTQLQLDDGRMIPATKWGREEKVEKLELSPEEEALAEKLRSIWSSILSLSTVEDQTDFFAAGASSMDVTRLIEEVKDLCDVSMNNDDVYMSPKFMEFMSEVVIRSRGGGQESKFEYDAITIEANGRTLQFPNQLFVNGEFVNSSWGRNFDCINPTDETVICKVESASVDDVNTAVKAAKYAFEEGEWGKMNARDRGALMYKLADLMEEHKEELATLESLDSGAVYTLALKTHIGFSIDSLRYFAGWCDKIQGKTIPINHARPSRNLSITKREPIGVCGIVIPWNYPLMMLAWKISPCLAAGNTVVLKPAQVTPLTALKFAELSARAGFPKGVINILPGKGSIIGQAFSDHPDIRKIGFTGSTEVGKGIMKSCAESNAKRVSLELGGKSPLIIFNDCDLDRAVRQSLGAVFFNKGENCIAAGRLFVERQIHNEFIERIVEEVKKMKIGDPLDRSVSHGPQNHKAHLDSLLQYIKVGVEEGASLVYGGKQLARPGYFLEPTVFTDVEDHMMIAKEESFGPVMIVSVFENGDVDGVIRRANATEFGLASGVFTRDINKAMYVSDKIQAGTCFVNCYNKTDTAAPFGGFKQSGFGKDLGEEALNEYLQTKVVTIEF